MSCGCNNNQSYGQPAAYPQQNYAQPQAAYPQQNYAQQAAAYPQAGGYGGAQGGAGCGGQTQTINNAPIEKSTVDSETKYTQNVVNNRNDIYINQPIINNRDHYVNNVNSQIIRNNNHYHYKYCHMNRDNIINRNYNCVYRQNQNFCDSTCTSASLPGTVKNIDCGTCYFDCN